MSKSFKNYIFILIILAGLIFLFLKKEYLKNFLNLNIFDLFSLIALTYLGFLMLGFSFKYIVKIFDINLSYKEWFGLTVCNTMFNYYVPAKGGTVVKAYYLKKEKDFRYSFYISLMAGSTILGFALTAAIGLGGILLIFFLTDRFLSLLAVLFFVFLLGSLLSGILIKYVLRLKVNTKLKKIHSLFLNIKEGISNFLIHPKPAVLFIFFSFLFILVMAVRLYVCFQALGYNVNFLEILIIRTITEFSFLVSIVPGNLGIKEGIIVFTAGIFSIQVDQAIAAAVLDRAVSMIVIFSLGFIYSKILLGRLTMKLSKEAAQ